MSTWRLISPVCRWLFGLCPGSMTTVLPDSGPVAPPPVDPEGPEGFEGFAGGVGEAGVRSGAGALFDGGGAEVPLPPCPGSARVPPLSSPAPQPAAVRH